jgi:type III pantothenate kinase
MKNLIIDIGNSGIKTALSRGSRIYNVKRYGYSNNTFINDFKKSLTYNKSEIENIGISCLNKEFHKIADYICKLKYSIKPYIIKFEKDLPINILYEKSLGTDRICSASAAINKYGKEKRIMIIDFGTATTYNLIVNGTYLGGLITPGILTSIRALNTQANLPMAIPKNINKLISNRTKSNILSGVLHQSLFTTEEIIKRLRKKYKGLFVICTGGLSDFIFKKTKLINARNKNLVLEGINIILNYRINKI